jgi:hypothetical protein
MKKRIMDITLWEEISGVYAEVLMPSDKETPGHRRFYSLETLLSLLDLSKEIVTREDGQKIDLGLIPKEMYDGVIYVDKGNVLGQKAVFVVEEGVRNFRYSLRTKNGTEREEGIALIPFPKLLFIASAKNGHTSGLSCFAFSGNLLTPDTKLYSYPFGNVYPTGSVCMGGFGMDIHGYYDLYSYVQAFFELVTNDDLYDGTRSNKSGLRQLDFIKSLEGKEKFPKEMLAEIGTYGRLVQL